MPKTTDAISVIQAVHRHPNPALSTRKPPTRGPIVGPSCAKRRTLAYKCPVAGCAHHSYKCSSGEYRDGHTAIHWSPEVGQSASNDSQRRATKEARKKTGDEDRLHVLSHGDRHLEYPEYDEANDQRHLAAIELTSRTPYDLAAVSRSRGGHRAETPTGPKAKPSTNNAVPRTMTSSETLNSRAVASIPGLKTLEAKVTQKVTKPRAKVVAHFFLLDLPKQSVGKRCEQEQHVRASL